MTNIPPPFGSQQLHPPTSGSMVAQNFGPPLSMQFRPAVPSQQGQPFIPSQPQHYAQNVYPTDMPTGQNQPPQFSQTMQQYPPAPNQHGYPISTSHTFSNAYGQPNRPPTPVSMHPQQSNPQFANSMTNMGGPGPYNFPPATHGQTLDSSTPWPSSQIQGSYGEQTWLPGNQGAAGAPQPGYSPAVSAAVTPLPIVPTASPISSSDWQEHTATDGRRYYYNRKTKQSSWEKPLELMTPIEKADASTVWKEFSTPDGKKYYYNKVTKQSKWTIPEELQLAREQAEAEAGGHATQSHTPITDADASVGTPVAARTPISMTRSEAISSPIPVLPAIVGETAVSASSQSPVIPASTPSSVEAAVVPLAPSTKIISSPSAVSVSNGVHSFPTEVTTLPVARSDNGTSQSAQTIFNDAMAPEIEEAKKGMAVAGKVNATPVEEKSNESEPLQYATKQEAKTAFKALLESAKVESDWTWDQAMRVIVNDKRYGALRTLGERKQAFNEYLGQRKKVEAEERRMRQKKAREEFTKMLEECQELSSSTRWREAVVMFENDERFKAVERVRDREDLFVNYMVELQKKEKAMAQEKHKQNLADFKKFLESCDFIKASTQWRRVQDRLEDDERSLRLEKVDRLMVFQDYIRDLEMVEEEQKKLQKEQLRRAERKNRDAFRKLMDEHVIDGTLTAKTQWRDYCMKVKESLPYMAVASNTSGSTPKDLFEDVLEELQDKYHEDKTRVKELTKTGKLVVTSSTWTFEDFKEATKEDLGSPEISDINLKLAFEELLDRIKEKEEKEAKKRKRLADEFTKLLQSKEIALLSSWEECKLLVEDSQEYRAISDEDTKKHIFDEYIANMEEKAKEKELKREMEKAKKEKEREEKDKRNDRERKDKEREREKDKDSEGQKKDDTDSETHVDSGHKEEKKRDKDRERKHRKRRQNSVDDDVSSDREETKKSRRHGSDRKKSRRHNYSDSDSDNKHKRHKRDKDSSSSRKHGHDELEDGELGDAMET